MIIVSVMRGQSIINVSRQGQPLLNQHPRYDAIPQPKSPQQSFEGEDFRTPVAYEGEDFRKPVRMEGEDFRTPVAYEGEDFRKPVALEGEDFRKPIQSEGEDFRKPVLSEGEDFRTPVASAWSGEPASMRIGAEHFAKGLSRIPVQSYGAPLRLIHVGPSFINGGVEQHAMSLAKFLDPRRVNFVKCLVTNPTHLCPRATATMPVPVEYCPPSEIHRASSECDVMLLWGDGYNEFLKPARPALCVFVAHGESWWTAKTIEDSDRVVDHTIAVSPRVLQRACYPTIPSTMIMNGVDLAHLGHTRSRAEVRERFGFASNDFVLGTVGRFSQEKRMPLLIEAVARLPRRFKLLLVGHGARRAELQQLANDLIPGRFAFAATDNYLGDHYRAMDAFGLVSDYEGFGLVLAEAMFCERPVIATNIGFVPDIIRDRINGQIVEPTPEAIADAVRLLQEHPEWAKGMAAEGRATADTHFHAARMAREYEDLLWSLWQARKPALVGAAR